MRSQTVTDPHTLADEIRNTITGPMWHGPALNQALAGLTYAAANTRPIHGAHSIWEIVLHVASWADVARTRLGPSVMRDPVPSKDWPAVPSPSAGSWRLALEQMASAYEALAKHVASLSPDDLARVVPGRDYTVETMLRGVIEHGTYHGGQIVMLKKAMTRR
jgi:uncharacterized damage-inducible protein DinB